MDEARRLIIAFYYLRPLQKAIYQLHLTPEIFSSLHSWWNCMKSIFNHCWEESVALSTPHLNLRWWIKPASEEGYSVLRTSVYYPSPLSIVYILNPAVRVYTSASKGKPGFAGDSFKCAYPYRKGSGWDCSPNNKNPEVNTLRLKTPSQQLLLLFFYSWDNATKHSSKI